DHVASAQAASPRPRSTSIVVGGTCPGSVAPDTLHCADGTVGHQGAHLFKSVRSQALEADLAGQSGAGHGLGELVELGQSGGGGFFQQQVGAVLECGTGQGQMGVDGVTTMVTWAFVASRAWSRSVKAGTGP